MESFKKFACKCSHTLVELDTCRLENKGYSSLGYEGLRGDYREHEVAIWEVVSTIYGDSFISMLEIWDHFAPVDTQEELEGLLLFEAIAIAKCDQGDEGLSSEPLDPGGFKITLDTVGTVRKCSLEDHSITYTSEELR